jgi:citrate lyase beta subunit
MIEKAIGLEVDVIVFDLEDGVPEDAKEIARDQVRRALEPSCAARRFVRTRATEHADFRGDLEAVAVGGLDGIVLPKVECAEAVDGVSRVFEEMDPGPAHPQIVGMIECASGLVKAPEIAAAVGLSGLMFGAEDFAQDLGILSTGAPGQMLYARSSIVVAAASAGKFAVDKVFLDVQNSDGLTEEARMARELGFSGKSAIHPAQVEVIHKAFEPTEDEMVYARKVVAAFAAADGEGPIAVEGRMVDPPVLAHAKRILGEESA